jgi:RNA polymerase sigma-70 factor, ECF subfamily
MLGEASKNIPMTDDEVVARVLAGERELFEVLMRRYNRRLYRVVLAILRDDAEVEDVMQQAYVNAYRHLGQFEHRALFSTWLTKIAIYEAQARARRRSRFVPLGGSEESEADIMDTLESKDPDPERAALTGELRTTLEAAIESLPERYRTVFTMREIEDMSTTETALCLDINEDTVKTRLHRARVQLREELYRRAGPTARTAFSFQAVRCDRVVVAVLDRIAALAEDDAPASSLH